MDFQSIKNKFKNMVNIGVDPINNLIKRYNKYNINVFSNNDSVIISLLHYNVFIYTNDFKYISTSVIRHYIIKQINTDNYDDFLFLLNILFNLKISKINPSINLFINLINIYNQYLKKYKNFFINIKHIIQILYSYILFDEKILNNYPEFEYPSIKTLDNLDIIYYPQLYNTSDNKYSCISFYDMPTANINRKNYFKNNYTVMKVINPFIFDKKIENINYKILHELISKNVLTSFPYYKNHIKVMYIITKSNIIPYTLQNAYKKEIEKFEEIKKSLKCNSKYIICLYQANQTIIFNQDTFLQQKNSLFFIVIITVIFE